MFFSLFFEPILHLAVMVYMLLVGVRYLKMSKKVLGKSQNLVIALGGAFIIFSYLTYAIRPSSSAGRHLTGALTAFHALFALLVGPLNDSRSKLDTACGVASGVFALALGSIAFGSYLGLD